MTALFRRARVRVPTVLQMEATECGAASLGMVLAHYGRWVPLERLRVDCGVSRDGSKAVNILKAARSYGLEARGHRVELGSIADLKPPFIVFWNFNHFVVVEGVDRRRGGVWINDPANGPRTASWAEFDEGYTGICLVMTPGPSFRTGGGKPRLSSLLRSWLGHSGGAIAFLVLANLALVLPQLAVPAFSKAFIDGVLIAGSEAWLAPLLAGLALTALLTGALAWLQQMQLARMEMKLALARTSQFLWHVLRLPIQFFTQRHAGEINSRLLTNDRVAQMLSGDLASSVAGLFRLAFFAAVMLTYDLVLACVTIGLGVLQLVVLSLASRAQEDASRRLAKQRGLLSASTVSGISLIETLKAGGMESDFFRRYAGTLINYINVTQSLGSASTWLRAAPALVGGITDAAVLGLGGLRVMNGALTIGDVVAFQSLAHFFNQPLSGLVGFFDTMVQLKSEMARLSDVLRYPSAPRLATTELAIGRPSDVARRLSGRIAVEGLVFGYSRLEPPILKDLSLHVEPGMHVALVGASGSGKSTIARLLAGLHDPWSGRILYDGQDLAALPHQTQAGSVGVVDQDILLLEGTVRNNVSLWDPTLPDQDIISALRDAEMLGTVMGRPGGIGGDVLEGGRNLSGGQRQRLEIARAMVGRPSIMILDEATSALDTVSEAAIMQAIRRRGATCVIVAHRLSTIRDCDEIILLERGQIAERGTHAELMSANGPYRKLVGAE